MSQHCGRNMPPQHSPISSGTGDSSAAATCIAALTFASEMQESAGSIHKFTDPNPSKRPWDQWKRVFSFYKF